MKLAKRIDVEHVLRMYPSDRFSRKYLLVAKAGDEVFQEWVTKMKTPKKKEKKMMKYLAVSVKVTKRFIDWINE